MHRYRPHHSLVRLAVIRLLYRWAKRHLSDQKRCKHQKLTDALLVALLLARLVFKHPYPSIWWNLLRADRSGLPSYTQAYTRGLRLLDRLEALVQPSGGWFKEAATKRKVKAFPSYTGKRPITRSYSRWASPSASRE